VVKKVAARDGLEIQTVVFSDYLQPNAALASGDLDANAFQHRPYLESQTAARLQDRAGRADHHGAAGYLLAQVQVGGPVAQPGQVGIQNDPSNGNRALLLLQKAGLIKLKPGVGENGVNATPLDIIDNPRKLKLIELDAAQLPRSLDDLTAA
jgi:D-methionine transport system substrate-binding protein